jgi:protease I
MKSAVMIIAFEMFRDEEYAEPKVVLIKAGIAVTTASSKLGMATGKLGMKAKVDIALDQVHVQDYDAVLFIGGPGSFNYYDNPTCHKIAQETVKQDKVLGAICAAPGILARAGVLKGKSATMFDDTGEIHKGGGTFIGQGVVIDGQLITATGPQTAKAWGEAIAKALS